jgi:hypothetical protein
MWRRPSHYIQRFWIMTHTRRARPAMGQGMAEYELALTAMALLVSMALAVLGSNIAAVYSQVAASIEAGARR